MGGIPSCKCNKDCDTAEICLKTEGEINMKPKDLLQKDLDINDNIMTKVNKKFNLSALNISDNDLLKIDKKTLIKNFFGRSDNSMNFSPVRNNTLDKSTSSISEEDKANQSQLNDLKVTEKISGIKKKTPPLEIINEVNTEDNIQDYLNKHSAKKLTFQYRKEMSNNSLVEVKNRSSSNLPKTDVNPNPYRRKQNEVSVKKNQGEENFTIESKKVYGSEGNTSMKNDNSYLGQGYSSKFDSKEKKIHEVWKNIDISSILNEKKLENLSENEMIFHSELFKYNIPTNHKSQPYINKFLVLTKTELLYYKSKETFLRCQNPLFRLDISSVKQCNRVELESSETCKKYKLQTKLHHFYLHFSNGNSDNNHVSPNNNSNQSFSKNNFKISNIDQAKKISLIPRKSNDNSENNNISKCSSNSKFSIYVFTTEVNFGSKLTLVFASSNEDLINKWVGILNYILKQ